MKILSKKTAYQCPILRVEEREVLESDGKTKTYYFVIRQPNVSIIALTNDKKIVLTKETIGKNDQPTIQIPSGKLDKWKPTHQELIAQAKQELEEEAGYNAGNIELFRTFEKANNWLERTYYQYTAWNLEDVGQKLEAGENITCVLVSVEEATKMAKANEFYWPDINTGILEAIKFYKNQGLI